ncbi:MAG: Asp-tRNA(Asn)/Glu-tRNA(Gln) amidotransferase subunit GatA [Candidatus Vogelbacteria bacterium]|nr:Asp-tRNA(Asn)/Glu-tRNA(Gln) amidotransferase subunit GatA [Candidatus Vogelbacteria bacterium]
MPNDLTKLSLVEASEGIKNRHFSSVELTKAYRAAIEENDGDLHAYIEVFDDALEQAERADSAVRNSSRIDVERKLGRVGGVPIAMKDNILIKGKRASAASRVLDGYIASYDATATKRLREHHAVFLGRTNMDEFAMGSSTENSAYGPSKNPIDQTRVPGGSSGGSAVAVAGGMAVGALGSETGGSVRQPAAFCGIVGLKPTYGAVSRSGLIALASSLDQIGFMARTVRDAQALFEAVRGNDPLDATTVSVGAYEHAHVEKFPRRIGIPEDFLKRGIDQGVRNNFDASVAMLEKAGYEVVSVSLPHLAHALAVYYILMPAEASTNLARFDGVKYGLHVEGKDLLEDYLHTRAVGFGPEPRRRILLGTYVLSAGYYDAYYNKANALRARINSDLDTVFAAGVSAIVTPTTPTPPFKIGEKSNDPVEMYLSDLLTVSANLAGIPAISVPSGKTKEGLPLGFQIMAPRLREDILFSIGSEFERLRDEL